MKVHEKLDRRKEFCGRVSTDVSLKDTLIFSIKVPNPVSGAVSWHQSLSYFHSLKICFGFLEEVKNYKAKVKGNLEMTSKKIHGYGRFSKLYLFKLCLCKSFSMLWVLGFPLHFVSIQRIHNLASPLYFCSLRWGDFLGLVPKENQASLHGRWVCLVVVGDFAELLGFEFYLS